MPDFIRCPFRLGHGKIRLSLAAAFAGLSLLGFAGCAGPAYLNGGYTGYTGPYYSEGYPGPYTGPYYGGYGPYNAIVVGGGGYYGGHHFYGHSFGHGGGGFHGGGSHGGGGRGR